MAPLLGIHSISKAYGSQILFEELSFTLTEGERVGLVGPNGAGKTTLLRILAGEENPDEGHLTSRQGLRIAYTAQEPHFADRPIEEIVIEASAEKDHDEKRIQARILLGKAEFTDFQQPASVLSGGWKKRLDIVCALAKNPDLLLLDEPTNHLDLEGILWLENLLKRIQIPYVVISHDRYFLEHTTNKIIELNRCYPSGLFVSTGNFQSFLIHKQAFLEGQLKNEESLASLVREETEWLRRSPKARTTKSQARVQRAHQMMEELNLLKRRNQTKTSGIKFNASERATRKLITATNLGISFGDKKLFSGINLQLSPGSRLGIVGKNGTGKTTLLKMLASEVKPKQGTIKYADDLRIVYFDQHREKVAGDITLYEALGDGNDQVTYHGRSIHVNGWAQRFLFTPDRLALPVKYLSGGERARILIAKLMLKPADVLFLDEPTNDLDIETLEVMEQSLNEFSGAVVLISHDRCLMENVCTSVLGLGEENSTGVLYADYRQWEKANRASKKNKAISTQPKSAPPQRKLSYQEKKELEAMEGKILKLEAAIDDIQKKIDGDPSNSELFQEMADAHQRLEGLFSRWEYLNTLANQ